MLYIIILFFMFIFRPFFIFGKQNITTNVSSSTCLRNMSSSINTTITSVSPSNALPLTSTIIPPFNIPFRKGGHGKIAIIGGSFEYTGAPYYSGISSLKTGADLVWIICSMNAGIPIKAYSPELIVHPLLPDSRTLSSSTINSNLGISQLNVQGDVQTTSSSSIPSSTSSILINQALQSFQELLNRLDTVVIGPGLGRDKLTLETVEQIITLCSQKSIPLVLDGDALYLLSIKPTLLQHYPFAFLTPNAIEFRRLWEAVYGSESIPDSDQEASIKLIQKYSSNIGIIKKGKEDIIIVNINNQITNHTISAIGSPRRCGGQGDVLAGTLGTFLSWGKHYSQQLQNELKIINSQQLSSSSSLSNIPTHNQIYAACAHGAALLTRNAAQHAFAQHKRSMTTPDMIQNIGIAFEELFPDTLYFPLTDND